MTCGDVAYDLSKGLPVIMWLRRDYLDVPVDAAGAQTLANCVGFVAWLAINYPSVKMRDVRLIVAAH